MDVKEFIRTIPAFDHVGEQELERVAKLAGVREIKRGTVVDAQGDPAKKFYILVKGRVAVTLDMDFGVSKKSYIVTTVGPGQMFAWSGLVGNPNYTAGGKTLTDCVVLEFEVAELEKEFENDPQLGYSLMKAVAQTVASRLRHMQLQLAQQHAVRESAE
jgi:CRP/FNR family transcriptional regulator